MAKKKKASGAEVVNNCPNCEHGISEHISTTYYDNICIQCNCKSIKEYK